MLNTGRFFTDAESNSMNLKTPHLRARLVLRVLEDQRLPLLSERQHYKLLCRYLSYPFMDK